MSNDPELALKLRWERTTTDVVEAKLAQIDKEERREKPLVALYMCGSLCPVHRQHIENVHMARKYFEERGCVVVGAWIATSGDPYVKGKYTNRRREFLPWKVRIELIELALSDEREKEYIRVDKFDGPIRDEWGVREEFVEFYDCLFNLQTFLNDWMEKERNDPRRIQAFLVAGADLINSCDIWNWPESMRPAFVCIGREDKTPPLDLTEEEQISSKRIWLPSSTGGTEDVSSTEINRILSSGEATEEKLIKYVHPLVAKRLIELRGGNKREKKSDTAADVDAAASGDAENADAVVVPSQAPVASSFSIPEEASSVEEESGAAAAAPPPEISEVAVPKEVVDEKMEEKNEVQSDQIEGQTS